MTENISTWQVRSFDIIAVCPTDPSRVGRVQFSLDSNAGAVMTINTHGASPTAEKLFAAYYSRLRLTGDDLKYLKVPP